MHSHAQVLIRTPIKTAATRRWMKYGGALVIVAIVLGALAAASYAFAATDCEPANELCHPFKGKPLTLIAGGALQTIIGMLGVVAFIVIIVAAVRWMTAAGAAETIGQSQQTIVWAFLGLLVASASYVILEFVFDALRKAFYET